MTDRVGEGQQERWAEQFICDVHGRMTYATVRTDKTCGVYLDCTGDQCKLLLNRVGEGQAGPRAFDWGPAINVIRTSGAPALAAQAVEALWAKDAALRASEAALARQERHTEVAISALHAQLTGLRERAVSAEASLATMTQERDRATAERDHYCTRLGQEQQARCNTEARLVILLSRETQARAEATKAECKNDGPSPCPCACHAAIRAPQPPEPEKCANDGPSPCPCACHVPSSPPPPSASGLLLTLKRAANLLDCGAALRTSECSPADPCAACLVHADVEAEIRKLEAPPPSEEPIYTGRRDPESPCPVCRELRPCGWCSDCDPEHFSDGVHAACFPVPSPPPPSEEPRPRSKWAQSATLSNLKVGCERLDGTLNIHLESEGCEVCEPVPSPSPTREES